MLAGLPRACDVGTKRNAKGHTTSWIGYKLPRRHGRWRDPHQLHHDLGIDA